MTKAGRTRQHIIEKTAPLFNVKGFEGTSLSDLTEVTGLTKGALYGNFADKEEIALEAFRYSIRKVRDLIRKDLAAAKSNKQQLLFLLDFYAHYVKDPPVPGGCPLLNAAVEVDDHRTSMRKVVAREINATVDFMTNVIQRGIEAGEFKRTTRARELACTFFCCIEGAVMFSRVERSHEPMNIIVSHCKKILNQISQ